MPEEFRVSRLIVGAWQLSEGHNVDTLSRDEVFAAFDSMADAGLATFDCADIYTGVEELIGDFLRHRRARFQAVGRSPIRIHTKFVPDRDVLPHITKSYVEQIIDRSLRRLGVETLDLVQFAWWDYNIPGYVDSAVWLQQLAQAGKIRYLGVANFDVPRLHEIVDAGVPIVSHQVQYSLLDHRPEEGMVEFCHEHGITLLCYGTLAGGFLTNDWLGKPDPGWKLPNRSLTKYRLMIDECGGWEAFQELLAVVHQIATTHGVSISNIAVRYVLDRAQVGAAIVGVRSREHVEDNLRTLSLRLDGDEIAELREIAVPQSPRGDVYTLERTPNSAHASIMRYNLNRQALDDPAMG
jgi:aryl-alcohol dehydrogenase-like predicted oxidoreductase